MQTPADPAADAGGLLGGLTVLEISSFVAAPLGGLTLAQLGAEVIRIDPVGGGADLGRWPLAPSGTSLYWTGLNKGKRSVTLNFREAEGRRILGDLLVATGPGGGIVLTNAAGQDCTPRSACSPRSGAARAPGTAPLSRWRLPTSPSPSPGTWDSWRKPRSTAPAVPGSGITCTEALPVTSVPPTASGSWWSR